MSTLHATPPNDDAISDIDGAARRVLSVLGVPLHALATTAALEGQGVRDIDAARIAPGCKDVFELGLVVHARALELVLEEPSAPTTTPVAGPPGWRRLAHCYGRGIAYSLPLIAQGTAVVILGVSVWGSSRLTADEQTAIGLALVLSLIAAGPATQAITRRLYYYYYQSDWRALERTTRRWIAAASAAGALLGASAAAALLLTDRWSDGGLAFCLFLALQPTMWIANAVLFTLWRSRLAALAVVVPTLPLWLALQLGLPAVAVHVSGLALGDALLVIFAVRHVRRWARGQRPARPPLPAIAFPQAVGGYALWGLVYFLLIFSDRLIAWTATGRLTFRPGYEAALQIALVPLLLVLPLLEHVLVRFGEVMQQSARAEPSRAGSGARRALRTVAGLVAACTGIYAVLATIVWIVVRDAPAIVPLGAARLAGRGDATTALACALVAYGCFVAALGLAGTNQLLQRPWPMVAAGSAAVAADVAVGLVAAHHGAPEQAAFGLLAGGVVFLAGILAGWARDRDRLGYLWFASG